MLPSPFAFFRQDFSKKHRAVVTKRVKRLAMIFPDTQEPSFQGKRKLEMPKYYVESGKVRLVLDADTAEQAAVKALQWSCDRQAEVFAEPPTELIREAEALEFRLDDEITVNETGFGRLDALTFDTLDIVAVWQGAAFTWY